MTEGKNVLKWSIFIVVIVGIVAGGIISWWASSNATPVVKIPTPTMPKPNGYDYFASAGKLVRDERKIDFAAVENSMPGFPASPDDRIYSISEKAALVKENSRALEELRKGLKYDCRARPARSFNTLFPEMPACRYLARLLKLEARVEANQGDWNGAMDSCLDGMEMGADVTRGGVLIHELTGTAILSIDRAEAWKAVGHLSAEEARSAGLRLEKIMSRQAPFADVLEEEKWCGTASLLEIFSKPGWRKFFNARPDRVGQARQWLSYNKRRTVFNYTQHMDKEIAAIRKPYACYKAPPMSKDEIVEIMRPVVGAVYFDRTRCDCGSRLLLISLALRAYKLEHGVYPTKLSELIPGYLKKLPDDPFALSGTFMYKLSGNSYTLYSIGPDGKDDGGKPVYDPSMTDTYKYFVQQDSKDDIVAGVNK